MGKAIITEDGKTTELATTREILSVSLEVANLDDVSVDELVTAYKQVDYAETAAIQMIKTQGDFKRGSIILAIKTKEPESWVGIVKKQLKLGEGRADELVLFYKNIRNVDALIELKISETEKQPASVSFKVNDLLIPNTQKKLKHNEGLSKQEKADIKKELKAEFKDNDNSKELVEEGVQLANAMKKIENHTKKGFSALINGAEDAGYEIIEAEDGSYSITGEGADINDINNELNALGKALQDKAQSFLGKDKKDEKYAEFGWTEEDQIQLDNYAVAKNKISVIDIDPFFKDNHGLWKTAKKELTKLLHPDTGISPEAQTFLNGIGAEMGKLDVLAKYDTVRIKWDDVLTKFNEWKQVTLEDVILELDLDNIKEVLKRDRKKNKK